MRKLLLIVAAAAAFGLGPSTTKLGATWGALAWVALAITLAIAASAIPSALAAAGGALGGLASGLLVTVSPAAAGAALVGLCYAERTSRVRSRSARLAHVGVAIAGGALAGMLAGSYASGALAVRLVAVTVAAVLVALPLLIDADDALAHALTGLADDVPEPCRAALQDGADLRRHVDEALLDRKTARQVRDTWRALLRLAEARARIERSGKRGAIARDEDRNSNGSAVVRRLDQRLVEHVAALRKAYLAADTAKAAEMSLDDGALRRVEDLGDSIEQATQVILDEPL
jgi:hypothetical protein